MLGLSVMFISITLSTFYNFYNKGAILMRRVPNVDECCFLQAEASTYSFNNRTHFV
jgi:hypothetical protein